MKKLRFRSKYRDKILEGKKRTTLRRETKLKPGDRVLVEVGNEQIGEALIREVFEVKVEELTDHHAREDGFSSLDELFKELKSIYGKDVLRKGTKLKLIRFDMKPEYEGENELRSVSDANRYQGGASP